MNRIVTTAIFFLSYLTNSPIPAQRTERSAEGTIALPVPTTIENSLDCPTPGRNPCGTSKTCENATEEDFCPLQLHS